MADSGSQRPGPKRRASGGGSGKRGQPGRANRRSQGSKDGGGRGRSGSSRRQTGDRRDQQRRQADGRSGRNDAQSRGSAPSRRRDLQGAAANLPNWVVEALARVTPPKRVAGALTALGEASEAFAAGSYQRALRRAEQAKDLAPRDTTVREVLGLAAYRLGDWQKALAELRAFRRMAGETTHLPVEMDILRALQRYDDVEAAWQVLRDKGGRPAVMKEGSVVYASHLIDRGDLEAAWRIVGPKRLTNDPHDEDLRQWYVAARVAALSGDADTAAKLRNSILEHDPAFPGIDELEKLIAGI